MAQDIYIARNRQHVVEIDDGATLFRAAVDSLACGRAGKSNRGDVRCGHLLSRRPDRAQAAQVFAS
ncbi:MAG: hypothetical protein WC809_13025 [Sinimarinibacterium sp.]|jgi:hypothetical protein